MNNSARSAVRPHLGVGWAFPVRPTEGKLQYVRDEEDVEQAIGIILETAQNERVMNPNFGAGLQTFLFAANSSVTHRAVEEEIMGALLDWEARIRVERVSASAAEGQANLMLIEIDYVVRRTNAFYNLVYPFYLTEAG